MKTKENFMSRMHVESHTILKCVALISERNDVVELKQYRKETPEKCLNLSHDGDTQYTD